MKAASFLSSLRPILVFAFLSIPCLNTGAQTRAKAEDPQKQSYKLQPMDLLKIQIYQEPELDREVRVSKARTISLPLVGNVDVRNRSVREAEQLISSLYDKDFLVNPQVNITVIEYTPRTVNILGAVNSPGSVLIPPEKELTLLEAVARCGGFSRLANRSRVSLTRTLASGETENYTVNADQIMAGDGNRPWSIQSGDVIFVPERVL